MRIPTIPRQSTADKTDTDRTPVVPRRDDDEITTTTLPPVRPAPAHTETERARAISAPVAVTTPAPRARTSFIATLGLVLAVAGALLVLSGPLLGYGMGVAAIAAILSLAGVFTTRKRHVAGKGGALIGLVLSVGAIVIGVLALTGQLYWLGTDTQTVPELRTWLDTQFETRI
ncbi:hypothetical protein QLQ12_04475 [Actinoplanes sp. NEAU-A12]|uniref:DUF4190 domain-containing protein n=1 Tax=Actinoplanes sandaracinus TaxID=3045177 RepID=A0ABT6WDQ3_9ACTN|nr:hypothetical protein [Actinoplanes sandaracinus]MDI6097854.1 hypothetical protein [Actinoplanes sandaracinus]